MSTLTYAGTLHILTCGECSIPHAIPDEMYRDRLDNGGDWWCPNGHKLHFVTTTVDKLKRDLESARRSRDWANTALTAARDQAAAAERRRRAVKGHLTRMRNRIAAGVCPVAGCRRHFDNVQAHLQGQHQDWLADHDLTALLGGSA